MVDDKDIESVMKLLPVDAHYYWTQPSTKRAFAVEKIAEVGERYGLKGKAFTNVEEAYKQALSESKNRRFHIYWRLKLCCC